LKFFHVPVLVALLLILHLDHGHHHDGVRVFWEALTEQPAIGPPHPPLEVVEESKEDMNRKLRLEWRMMVGLAAGEMELAIPLVVVSGVAPDKEV
jgi:hypothetical protein